MFLVVMMERIYFDGIVATNLIEPREFSYVVLRAELIVFGGGTVLESILVKCDCSQKIMQ